MAHEHIGNCCEQHHDHEHEQLAYHLQEHIGSLCYAGACNHAEHMQSGMMPDYLQDILSQSNEYNLDGTKKKKKKKFGWLDTNLAQL